MLDVVVLVVRVMLYEGSATICTMINESKRVARDFKGLMKMVAESYIRKRLRECDAKIF
jgi:hypothetical protein